LNEFLKVSSGDLDAFIQRTYSEMPKSWPFSKENRILISEISEFLKLNTAETKNISLPAQWQFFVAWSIVQQAARSSLETFPKESNNSICKVSEAVHYVNYAASIYKQSSFNLQLNAPPSGLLRSMSAADNLAAAVAIPVSDVKFIDSDSEAFNPAHAICIDRRQQAVVLVVRGTLSVIDCITDIKAEYFPYSVTDPRTARVLSGTVHEGIFKGAMNIYTAVKAKLLDALASYPGFSLIITGHSLGAGTAALIGLLMRGDADFTSINYRAYCYGCPCVVSPELQPLLKDNIMTVSNGSDVITRSCFGSVKDLGKVLLFLRKREGHSGVVTASSIIAKTMSKQPIEHKALVDLYLEGKQECTYAKHLPPGVVYQIYDKQSHPDSRLLAASPSQFIGEFATSSFYEEIVFSKTALSDHMADMYQKSLRGLAVESSR
jgi:hypothetical protein